MALPWVRLDSHIASHDKILALLDDPSPKRWQAAFSYVCALGWSADHGTDGALTKISLPFIHGTTTTARLLVKYRLWDETFTGWQIHNFADRQMLAAVAASVRAAKSEAGVKGNCVRHHPKGCWTDTKGCSRA